MRVWDPAVGCDGRGVNDMTTRISTALGVDADVQAIIAAALIGAFLVFGAGFANSAALHTAAHDTRHSATFPCH